MLQTDGLAILPTITHVRSLQQCHIPYPKTRRVVTLAGIVQASLPKLRWDLPRVLNLNARSLSMEKIDELEVIITDFNVSIACVTETWFKQYIDDDIIVIGGFNCERKDRLNKRAGRVVCYLRNSLV